MKIQQKDSDSPPDQHRDKKPVFVAAVSGYSNSGKTTLLEKLIHELIFRGLRVGTIKHDVHGFEMDRQGKDTWRHKQAGASATIISSPRQIGMIKDVDHDHDPLELVKLMPEMDMVLLEGYKSADIAKIEVFRSGISEKLFCEQDPNLIAVVSDSSHDTHAACFGHDDIVQIADFLMQKMNLDGSLKRHKTPEACRA